MLQVLLNHIRSTKMNITAHKSLTLTALALALTVTAGSAFAATNLSSTCDSAPRADTRADFLVSFQNDERIAPRSIGPTDQGQRIAPRSLDSTVLIGWQNDEQIAPRSVSPTDQGEQVAPRSLDS
jgi:hypothetical protein